MSKFEPISNFFEETGNYKILPFRFARFQDNQYLMTNLIGEPYLINRNKLHSFANHTLKNDDEDYHANEIIEKQKCPVCKHVFEKVEEEEEYLAIEAYYNLGYTIHKPETGE